MQLSGEFDNFHETVVVPSRHLESVATKEIEEMNFMGRMEEAHHAILTTMKYMMEDMNKVRVSGVHLLNTSDTHCEIYSMRKEIRGASQNPMKQEDQVGTPKLVIIVVQ